MEDCSITKWGIFICFVVITSATIVVITTTTNATYFTDDRYPSYSRVPSLTPTGALPLSNTSFCKRICLTGLKDDEVDDFLPQDVMANDLMRDNRTAQNLTRTHHLTTNGSLSKRLWSFNSSSEEVIYMYGHALSKFWQKNATNLRKLRLEIASYHATLQGTSEVILDQANSKTTMSEAIGKGIIRISREAHRLLPKKNPLPADNAIKSCAVVGNSGILLKSGCGKEIDSHDFVIRCNLAKTDTFQQDAGTLSNLTTMNPSILLRKEYSDVFRNKNAKKRLRDDLSKFGGFIFVPGDSQNSLNEFRKIHKVMDGISTPVVVPGNPHHLRHAIKFWVDRSLKRRLSTGLYMTTLAVQMCQDISLFGFWPFPHRFYHGLKVPVPYHYFDNMTSSDALKIHAMDDEFNILLQLHNMGVLRIRLGSCE